MDSIVKQITDEFVESFRDESDYTGIVARLVGARCLPEGVDPWDERVIAIMDKCAEKNKETP